MRHLALTVLLFSSQVFGQIETVINFNGQNADVVKIDKVLTFEQEVQVEVPSTCTREVPYESYECRDVTRYREECSWVPASQSCWDEPDQVCRSVTRTRQECSNGPSRRVCSDIPVREVCTDRPSRQECRTVTRHREECSTGPSREVCTDRPSREVCTERPTREVCRPKPGGGQHCTTVGGGRTCNTVGGGQSCRTVPGERSCRRVPYQDRECETVGGGRTCNTVGGGQTCHDVEGPRVCRDVPYTDQECTTVSRRQCREVPGHNDCRDIPYSENVCGTETRYRSEPYACTRTETQVQTVEKRLAGDINVNFLTNGLVEEFPLKVILNGGTEGAEYSIETKLEKEPKVLVISKGAKVEVQEGEKELALSGEVLIEILEARMVTPAFPEEFTAVSLDAQKKLLTLTFKGQISAMGSIDLTIFRRGWFGRRSALGELKAKYPSKKVKLEGDKLIVDLSEVLNGKLKKLSVDLKLEAPLSLQGQVLNAQRPTTTEEFNGLGISIE